MNLGIDKEEPTTAEDCPRAMKARSEKESGETKASAEAKKKPTRANA
jgi:hypothetical protein